MQPLISIISVNFNHSHVTEAMIASVQRCPSIHPVEIIIVDNASTINPVPQWQIQYPDILFIRSETNLGFAGGNNVGIGAAKGKFLFLVNNDTEFTEGLMDTLVNTLQQNSKIGVVCPLIKYFDAPDTIQYAGFTPMNYYTCQNKCIGQFDKDNGQYKHQEYVTGYAHGAAMMVTRAAIDKAGLMHENYFLYYEELDWIDRIKKAGFEVWVNTNALIYHKESVSVGQKSALKEYYMNRNRILFIRRNAPAVAKLIFWCYFVLLVAPRNVLQYVKDGKATFIKQLMKAIYWNITQPKNSTYLGFKP